VDLSLNNFLSTLFEPNSLVCFTDHMNGYRAFTSPVKGDILFSINCLAPEDRQPTKSWHSKGVPRRADGNVAEYRNFLLELDGMPLEEQEKYVRDLVPVTSITYSGSKSNHFILSLETPLANLQEYQVWARRLHKLVTKADHTTKNPSRLSRLPFQIRPETGLEQKLIYLGTRLKNADLDSILPQLPLPTKRSAEESRLMITPQLLRAVQEPDVAIREFNLNSRNLLFYWLYNRFQDLGLSLEARQHFVSAAYSNLKDKAGFNYEEALMAARLK
jgi:hypothetical protein